MCQINVSSSPDLSHFSWYGGINGTLLSQDLTISFNKTLAECARGCDQHPNCYVVLFWPEAARVCQTLPEDSIFMSECAWFDGSAVGDVNKTIVHSEPTLGESGEYYLGIWE
jgi:hypothetical protein